MMECMTPITLKHKEKGLVHVPCNKCGPCLANKRSDWAFRLSEEFKHAISAYFITLTYNEEHLPSNGSLSKRDIQLFLKRLRAKQERVRENLNSSEKIPQSFLKWQIRYYIVGEYGPKTLRPHYHGLFFNVYPEIADRLQTIWSVNGVDIGFTHVGQVNPATIYYVTKYFTIKSNYPKNAEKPFTLMSCRDENGKPAGIGYQYLNRAKNHHINNKNFTVRDGNGYTRKIPRYYRDKIFTESEIQKNSANVISDLDKKFWEKMAKYAESGDAYYNVHQMGLENLDKKIRKEAKKGKL